MSLKDRTLFITGGSRGIGLAVALRAARDGANVAIAAKTVEPHSHLPGTIHSAARAIEEAGGRALPIAVDIRDEATLAAAIEKTAQTFGGIDILVNNASAISRSTVEETELKRWDLMMDVNARGTFAASRAALPYLRKSANPHVLTMSPPPNLDPRWFGGHVAYTISKNAMSMVGLGMAQEFKEEGIAFNSLWPRFGIATAAIEFAVGDSDELNRCRTPEIMADAAYAIVTKPSRECTGNFFIDDTFLYSEGVRDFSRYKVAEGFLPRTGMFLPEHDQPPPNSY